MNVKLTEKEKVKISNPKELYGIMQRILLRENRIDREKEHFWIVGMNQAAVILYIELVSMGSIKKTLVEPMNVYRVAILKGATRVIAVHNHPSGSLDITGQDQDTTDRLIQVGRIIDIRMEDHLIISPTTYLSFKNTGLMEELEKSIKYVPTYKLIEQVRKEEQAIKEEIIKEAEKRKEAAVKAAKEEAIRAERVLREEAVKEAVEAERMLMEERLASAVNRLLGKNLTTEEIAVVLNLTPEEIRQIIKREKDS